jgi:Arc/MetJ-type ribon-helix-helix transcriptional regulator
VTSEQIAIRLPSELLHELDELIIHGVYDSRAAAVRAGIVAVTALQRGRAIDTAIVDGYRRLPPTNTELDAALASLRESIAEEPW